MEHSPRQLFAMIRAGNREEVLNSSAPWYCVSCYYCAVRCPQDVSIPGIMYTLKSMSIKAGHHE
jgi:heterodisulfide reductase subunit C